MAIKELLSNWIENTTKKNLLLPIFSFITLFTLICVYLPQVKAASLVNGGVISNSISSPDEQDSYTFTASIGEYVHISMADVSGSTMIPRIDLYGPSGALLKSSAGDISRIMYQVTENGTHTVVAYDTNSNGTERPYDLHFVHMPGANEGGLLPNGGVVSESFDYGDLDSYTFTASVGENVHIRAADISVSTMIPRIDLYGPSGALLKSSRGDIAEILYQVTENGTHTVVAYDSNSSGTPGPYNLYFVHIPGANEGGLLFNHDIISDSFDYGDLDSYTFVADKGKSVQIQMTEINASTMIPRFDLYGPDGALLKSGSEGITTYEITENGTYTIVTYDSNSSGTPGPYELSLNCFNSSGISSECSESNVGSQVNPQKCPLTCETSVGNPINFSLGFKHQTETDYVSGVLSFKRFYRSDADWYTHSVGQRWRHNYDRSIVVTGDKAAAINEAGLIHTFEDDGSGNWSPIAEDNNLTATLVSIPTGYLYTTPSDTREYYNANGKLARIEFRGGESLNLTHDALNRLVSVSDENGRSLSFTYNGSDKSILSMTTPDGVYSYSYGVNNNLTTVTKPDSKTRIYHYEDTNFANALTGVTDEKGVRYATYRYDDQGRAISSENAGGVNNFTITYNADDSVTTTNPLGKQTTYYFETILGVRKITNVEGHQSANCAAANKANTYDARGFLESKTDWLGNVTTYVRDTRGLATSMTEATGSNAERTISYTYDPVYRLPETITETGKVSANTYDSDGRIISESITDTNTGETRTTTYTYHPNSVDAFGNTVLGRLANIDGSRTDVNDITAFEYDAQLNLIKITNALGHETEMLQFDVSGRPTLIKDSNGIKTRMLYDVQGRLVRVVQGTNTSIKAVTRYVFNDKGELTKTAAPNGTFLRYTYDDIGRLIRIINSDSKILYTLDNAGNRIREVYKDSAGAVRYKYRQAFDELSRVIRGIDDNGDKTRYAYDVNDNLTKITDGNLNKTRFGYDALDRQTRTVDALDGRTVQTFNELDQLTRVKDPRDNATRYVYNAFGDVIREISPDTGKTVNTVDAAGNTIRRKDARGVITRYSYDALNRLTRIIYPSDPSLNVNLIYDSGAGCGISIGNLCEIKDASGITRYTYDELSRLTQVTETRGTLSFTTSYAYDLAGNVTGMTLPSGRFVSYGLDVNNQISNVNADIGGASIPLASTITYLPFGGIEGLTYGNGISLTNSYNTAYQLTARHIGNLINDNYSYDAAGNITVKGTASYDYDPLYRLLNESSDAGLFDYSYDSIANRLTEGKNGSSTSYIYPFDSSKLSAINATPISYDAAGNIITDLQRSYTIDAAGRVQDVSISSAIAGSYVYNANNQRTSKAVNGSKTHYIYGLGGQLYGEYDASGNLIREYVYLNGEPLAQVNTGEAIAYMHTDHLGTPRVATDSNTAQVWSWQSDAFGNGTPSGSATVNLRFAGQYYDTESGLHYNWNRYYDPQTGRYITSDPIGLAGGINTYTYVNANPVMFNDPEGLQAQPSPTPTTNPAPPSSQPPLPANENFPRSLPSSSAPEIPWQDIARTIAGNCVKGARGGVVAGIAGVFIPTNKTCETNPEVFGFECDLDDRCELWYRQITSLVNQLKRRYYQLLEDKDNLYKVRSIGKHSWTGHQQQFNEIQRSLRNVLKNAESAGCKNYQEDAWNWATRQTPDKPLSMR